MNRLKRLLTPPLIVLAALLMWIEDSLWQWLKRITAWVAVVPLVRRFERFLSGLPPYPTMVVFLLPATLLLPLKLFAVFLVTRGHWLASLALLLTAKILGTAIVARMYVVCHPKLMTIGWFRNGHDWLIGTRDRLYSAIRAMPWYEPARALLADIRQAARKFIHSFREHRGLWVRWRAIRRWHRQRNRRPVGEQPQSS